MATIRKLRGRWQAQVRRRGVAPRAKSFNSRRGTNVSPILSKAMKCCAINRQMKVLTSDCTLRFCHATQTRQSLKLSFLNRCPQQRP
jgi:hypothetical protein